MARFFNPLLSPDIIYNKTKGGKSFLQLVKFSHEVAKDVIKKRKEEIPNSEKPTGRYVDFLDILLLAKDEDGKGLTDAEILDEVETFMFEGIIMISWFRTLNKFFDQFYTSSLQFRCGKDVMLNLNELPYLPLYKVIFIFYIIIHILSVQTLSFDMNVTT